MPSQAIKTYAYDESRNELTITFASGRGYIYSLVPPEVFAEFRAAVSRGAFLNRRIKDRYPYRRTPAQAEPQPSLLEGLKASNS